MSCPAILTGDAFLVRVLGNIDCQAQLIGSYGWMALGEPGSIASNFMTGLLALFVALYGIRLLFGWAPGARDVVSDVIKVGIVLTLAFSWPAFRTLAHDLVLKGPAEISAAVTAPILSESGAPFAQRLQDADNAIVQLTEAGSGRNTGQIIDREKPGGRFEGTALEDEATLGWARLAYLSGIIGSLALLRLVAGLLLALAPLAAGLLLFEQTRGLFSGWLRGLVLALAGATGVTVMLAAQLGVIGPWLADALRLRSLGYATPSAPTELFAMTLGFAIAQFGVIALMARIAFTRGWLSLPAIERSEAAPVARSLAGASLATDAPLQSRSGRIADHVETQMRREETRVVHRIDMRLGERDEGPHDSRIVESARGERLGSSWRRSSQRSALAAQKRDRN